MVQFKKSVFIKLMFMLTLSVLSGVALAQSSFTSDQQPTTVQRHDMAITCHKTSSILFPAPIKSVDIGSGNIIVRKASEVVNVLQLKGKRENFPETNLTVITTDGVLHVFTINYHKDPDNLSLELNQLETSTEAAKQPIIQFQQEFLESDLERCARDIIEANKVTMIKQEREFKIGLFLKGIYIKNNIMFFHFTMNNTSNVNYDVDFLRFYINDREKMRRTASQEIDIRPIYRFGNDKLIYANSKHDVVYALNKFTIPDAKNLIIEMFEANGGRHLRLGITNRNIVNARLIP